MRHGLSRTFLLAGSLLSLLAAGCASHPLATTAPKPIVLTASTARIVGNNARVDVIPQVEYIGYWTNEDTFVEWPLPHPLLA
jgi:hypothetical protein